MAFTHFVPRIRQRTLFFRMGSFDNWQPDSQCFNFLRSMIYFYAMEKTEREDDAMNTREDGAPGSQSGNLFAYGTLMCGDIMYEVSGCHLPNEPGTLTGYSRRSVTGESYPAIIPDREAAVDGVIYRNVPGSAWYRLDRFEGEMYERRQVTVILNNRTTLSAETYVIHPEYLNRLDQSGWDFDDFIRNAKANFQRCYKGYQAL